MSPLSCVDPDPELQEIFVNRSLQYLPDKANL